MKHKLGRPLAAACTAALLCLQGAAAPARTASPAAFQVEDEAAQTPSSTASRYYTAEALEDWNKTFYTADARLVPDPSMVGGVGRELPQGMRLAAEDGALKLYFDDRTTAFAVLDTRSGAVWSSVPPDRELDKVASGVNQSRLSALVTIDYRTSDGTNSYDSYTHSVAQGNFTVRDVEKGVAVDFRIGSPKTITSKDIPTILFKDRLEAYLAKMEEKTAADVRGMYRLYSLSAAKSEESRRELLEKYPALERGDLYVLRDKDSPLLYLIYDSLEAAGYTAEDLEADNDAQGLRTQPTEQEIFQVTLLLQLEGEKFIATVDGSRYKSPKAMPINAIHVLPFFGAANLKSRGYMLVPDGSGGLVYLNSFTDSETLSLPLYGQNAAIRQSAQASKAQPSRYPVFGMKNGGDAFMAVIEQGDGCASVNATVPGLQNSYNCLWASFEINPSDSFSTIRSDITGSMVTTMLYPAKVYSKDIRISYSFLQGEDAGYAGMAAAYRRALQEKGLLPLEKTGAQTLPFVLETVGAVDKSASILGLIPYDKLVTLTTFSQTRELVELLRDNGVREVALRLSGWMNGGMTQTQPDKIKVLSALGGRRELQAMLEALEGQGTAVYGSLQLESIVNPGWFYNKKRNAVRYLGNVYAHRGLFDLASGTQLLSRDAPYLLSPCRLPAVAQQAAAACSGLQFSGVALADLGDGLYADYNEDQFADRDDAIRYVEDSLAAFSGMRTMLSGGNAYALGGADILVDLPLGGSGYRKINETVPFYQMVLHGYVAYAGSAVNHADDPADARLKTMEYGASPYYQWAYADSSATKSTYYGDLFALGYRDTFQQAVRDYRRIDTQIGQTAGLAMTGHCRLADGVTVTVYEDGTAVAVNSTPEAVEVDGTVIPSYDWAVIGGTSHD